MKLNLLFGLLILAQTLFAQYFTEVLSGQPFDNLRFSSIAFFDVNSDGHKDVLITGLNRCGERIAKLHINDGMGNFTEMRNTPFDGVYNGSIAFSDINGDGHGDVLITGWNSSSSVIAKLYTNDGTGKFTEKESKPLDGAFGGSMAFADVNGDGHEDVLIMGRNGSWERIAKLYTNDGTGKFTEIKNTPFEGLIYPSMAFADVNGDGHKDVLFTGQRSSGELIAKLFINDGTGQFTEKMDTPFEGVWYSAVAFSDVNGDGYEDVLITGLNSSSHRIAQLYINDGMGQFTKMTDTPFAGVMNGSIAFEDVNGDGHMDIYITGTVIVSYLEIAKLYINDGMGNFTEKRNTPFDGVSSGSIAFSDINGDGHKDLLITGWNSNYFDAITKLYTNDGMGDFIEIIVTPMDGVWESSIAFSDINGDGHKDVLITGQNSYDELIAKLYTNDGMGNFTEMMDTPFEGVRRSSISFTDVNGDDHEDVLIIGLNSSGNRIARLYTNDGLGNFTEMKTPFDDVWVVSSAFSDVNGDGHKDVLIMGRYSSNEPSAKLYINDGLGNFTEMMGISFDGVYNGSITFSDVNGDGREDLFIIGRNSSNRLISKLYLNDGMGNFTEMMDTPFDGVYIGSIAFSDINGDGHEDVLITGRNSSNELIAKLYTNDGKGNFTEVMGTPFDGVWESSIAFSDVNSDGHKDVLITGLNSSNELITKLYTNDGMGNFNEIIDTPFDGIRRGSIAFTDINGNGHADVLITGLNSSGKRITKLYTNDGIVNSTDELILRSNLDVTMYPNPTKSDILNVRFKSSVSGLMSIDVYDINGRLLVKQRKNLEMDTQAISVDVGALAPGIYFIRLESGKRVGVAKFVVQ